MTAQVFTEDRSCIRSCWWRYAVVFAALYVVIVVGGPLVGEPLDSGPELAGILALVVVLWLIACLGLTVPWLLARPVRWEIDEQELRAFRGRRKVLVVASADVQKWSLDEPAGGWWMVVMPPMPGRWGSFWGWNPPRLELLLLASTTASRRYIRFPGMLRSGDGGLDDVAAAMTARFGPVTEGESWSTL